MEPSSLASLFVVAAILAFFIWARRTDRAYEAKRAALSEEWEIKRLSDEKIANVQAKFEANLVNGGDLPDGICWRDAYMYWNMMKGWYATLAARHRYDERLTKLKQDWLSYLCLQKDYATSRFLWQDGNEENREANGQAAYEAQQQLIGIEDAFAHAIGPEAVAELAKVRGTDLHSFDRSGREEMAPQGYKYQTVSVNPWVEKLVREGDDAQQRGAR